MKHKLRLYPHLYNYSRRKNFLQYIKKYLSSGPAFMAYNAGKKSYTVVCQEKENSIIRGLGKKFLHKVNHPYLPSPKVKWSIP